MSRIQRIACNLGMHRYNVTPYPLWRQCTVCGTVRTIRR